MLYNLMQDMEECVEEEVQLQWVGPPIHQSSPIILYEQILEGMCNETINSDQLNKYSMLEKLV